MEHNPLSRIIDLCREIDLLAVGIYRAFSRLAADRELGEFWMRMSREESFHVAFWDRCRDLCERDALPQVFDDPAEVVRELERARDVVAGIGDDPAAGKSPRDSFLAAFRLEYHALHPAFGELFRQLRDIDDVFNPGEAYAAHIDAFLVAMRRFGAASEELDLMGEMLHRLWRDNRRLADLSVTDELTGILNRRGALAAIRPLSNLAARGGLPVGVLMLDIDRFKLVNDGLGHKKGDEVLRAVARALRGCLRSSDVLGRYGGEEFIVFVPNTDEAALVEVAEKARACVAGAGEAEVKVTVSIGAAHGRLPEDYNEGLTRLIVLADNRLLAAKRAGRDRVVAAGEG